MYPSHFPSLALPLLLALSPLSFAADFDCENVVADKHTFDLSKLGGPHSVVTSTYRALEDSFFNTTYTVDICGTLKKTPSGDDKGSRHCPDGTKVCAITRVLQPDVDTITKVVAIAGALQDVGGSKFEYEMTRLKTSKSESDAKKEGVRIVLKGGKNPLEGPKPQKDQRAVIEFLCDKNRTGLEGEWRSEDRYDGDDKIEQLRLREPEDDADKKKSIPEHQLKKDNAALVWDSYGQDKDDENLDTLRLTWYTKHACESKEDSGDDEGQKRSRHWGFFTWFIIIVFLVISAYLIFGSWLNHTRYGARGWDLLPHGDTIRDIPYLLKDWMRQVLNTVQGTGSRGGYSAV